MAEHEARMRKLGPGETDEEFFAKRARADTSLRRGVVASSGPKPEPGARARVGGVDTSNMTLEELEELNRREAAAQAEIEAKKARTGPVYNKGGSVYLSDDLLKDVQAGNTRRRS